MAKQKGKKKTVIHDTFVRKIFKDLDVARDYFKNFLPAKLVVKLDLSKLKVEDTTHIRGKLERYFPDIVFTCPYGELNIQFCLLLEHKSTFVPYPHLQLMRYMLEKWEVNIDNKRPLEPVLPIILYHGKQTWKVRPFSAYFDGIDEELLTYMHSKKFAVPIIAELLNVKEVFVLKVISEKNV